MSTWTARQGVQVHSTINGFYEFIPDGYNGSTEVPCIIFFHGNGEKGNGTTELSRVLTHGVPKYINENGGVFPYNAIVLCPQMNVSFPIFGVTAMIEYAYNNYKIDPNKLSLTGLSMGGGVILDWLSQSKLNILKVASIVVNCPASFVEDYSPNSSNHAKANRLPMKFFHDTGDLTVPISRSTNWVAELNGGTPIIPAATLQTTSVGTHQAGWDPITSFSYDIGGGQNIYQFMLAQTKYNPLYTIKAINCGTSSPLTLGGVTWEAETGYFSGGSIDTIANIFGSYRSIGNTALPILSQTYRQGTHSWTIPVTNGTYTVRLHITEPFYTGVGQRVFNANIESGQGTLTNYDIVSTVGVRHVNRYEEFSVTVSDGNLNISFTNVTQNATIAGIEVLSTTPSNLAPSVSAGVDQNIAATSTTLTGSATDSDGTISTYAWTQISGAASTIVSPSSATTNITGLVPGVYVYRLTATDNSGASAFDDVQITVTAVGTDIYVKGVGRRVGTPNSSSSASVQYTDGTSDQINTSGGSPVKNISIRFATVDGQTRPTAWIWFLNNTLRIITKKGE